jgi:hypothetical protein
VFHREQVVAGGDARAALVHRAFGGLRAEQRAELGAQLRGGLEAAGSRLSLKKRFSAPGMWPAARSSGSTSPRKRSPARASISGVRPSWACSASTWMVRTSGARSG